MRIQRAAAFDGPSLHAAFPAVWLRIKREPADPAGALDAGALGPALTHLPDFVFGQAENAEAFVDRLAREGGLSSPAAAVAALALEIQRRVGADTTRASVAEDPTTGVLDVAFAFEYGDIGLLAGQLSVALLNLAARPAQSAALAEVTALRSRFMEFAEEVRDKPQAIELVRSFKARGIPVRRLHAKLSILGQGRFRKHLDYTITGNTRTLSTRIANDKMLANRVLRELGLPVTEQVLIGSSQDAVRAAARIGYPVVLKPRGGEQGVLVFVGLADAREVEAAHARIVQAGFQMIMERMVEGDDHRLLMIGGELAAATRRMPAHVVGDGRRSVAELVHEANKDPRRGRGPTRPLKRLALDDEAEALLRKNGFRRDGIPAQGEVVFLRALGNVSQGGLSIDVTDTVHPENREMAVRVAAACDADLLGIDFITPDITRSYREVGGAICEVNARPGTRQHEAPVEGRRRRVLERIVDSLYPPGHPARIPSAAILGGEVETAFVLAHVLKLAGHRVGLSVRGDVYIDGPSRQAAAAPSPQAAVMVLGDVLVDAAVMLFAPDDLARHGLGFDGATVGAVMEGGGTPPGRRDAPRIILDGARGTVVVNGDDPQAAALVGHAGTRRLAVFSKGSAPACAAGAALAITASAAYLEITDGSAPCSRLMADAQIPGLVGAVAIARAMGVAVDHIKLGLATLGSVFTARLGGFRVLRAPGHPVVIVDRLRDNAVIGEVCHLAAVIGDGTPGTVVIEGAAEADRNRAAAILAPLMPAAFRHVAMVGGAGFATVEDERTAIAEAIAGPGDRPGVVLILTDNPERACRFVAYATGGGDV